ncbi:MAG: hypothetical protein WD942_02535 [Dehalococcoidia bacterium]
MVEIDIVELAATTNFVHGRLLESEALRSKGDGAGAAAMCREAAEAACRTMRDIFAPYLDEIAKAAPSKETTDRIRQFVRNRDAVAAFLNAEEKALLQAGLEPALVEAVMNRCADFLDRNPEEISIPDIRNAFGAAQFRICQDAIGRLNAATQIHDKGLLRTYCRPILRAAVGVTIIGVNYKVFGPAEWLCSVSSGYGASWFPTDF